MLVVVNFISDETFIPLILPSLLVKVSVIVPLQFVVFPK